MGSYVINFSVTTDTWHFNYIPEDDFPGTQPESSYSNGELVPEGPWTAFVSPYAVQANSGIGLTLELQSGELLELLAHSQPPADTEAIRYVQFPGRQITLRVEHDEGIITFSYSETRLEEWIEVASFSPSSPVSEVGVVLRYDREEYPAGGQAGQARLLAGIWENVQEEVWLGEPGPLPARREAPPEATVTSTSEPLVHVIVGAQFGDLEFDIGKSVRWVTWYCDNVFVLDVNLGTPRYWIVNWAETFPDAKHTVTGINYFVRPTEFRKEQWRQYKLAFGEPARRRLDPVHRRPRGPQRGQPLAARRLRLRPVQELPVAGDPACRRTLGQHYAVAALLRVPALGQHHQRELRDGGPTSLAMELGRCRPSRRRTTWHTRA